MFVLSNFILGQAVLFVVFTTVVLADVFDKMNTTLVCSEDYCIPKVVWTFWDNDETMSEDVQEMINVTKTSLVNFTCILITSKNLSQFLDPLPTYFHMLTSRQKGDYLRICLIAKYGGIYLDTATFVNSGEEMEWFLSEALKSQCETASFDVPGLDYPFWGSFYVSPRNGNLTKILRTKYEELLEKKNFKGYVKDLCAKLKLRIMCYRKEIINAYYPLIVHEHPEFENRILKLPFNRSFLSYVDKFDVVVDELRPLLACVEEVRKVPFIKVGHKFRDGKRFNIKENVKQTCTDDMKRNLLKEESGD